MFRCNGNMILDFISMKEYRIVDFTWCIRRLDMMFECYGLRICEVISHIISMKS